MSDDTFRIVLPCSNQPSVELHMGTSTQGNLVFGVNGLGRNDLFFRISPRELAQKLGLKAGQFTGKIKHSYDACLTSKKKGWNTPVEVIDPIKEYLGDIGLDPCSNSGSIVRARTEWILERDGDSLIKPWGGYGLVYVNWAYGNRESPQGAEKCAAEGRAGTELIQLCKSVPGTKWFRNHTWTAQAIGTWKGRLTFGGGEEGEEKQPAPFESALAYWGNRVDLFMKAFENKVTFIKKP